MYSSQKRLIEEEEINLDNLIHNEDDDDEDIQSLRSDNHNIVDKDKKTKKRVLTDKVTFTNEKKVNVDIHAISENSSISDDNQVKQENIISTPLNKKTSDFTTTLANAFRKQLSKGKSESKETLLETEKVEQIQMDVISKQKKVEIITDDSSKDLDLPKPKKERKKNKETKSEDSIKADNSLKDEKEMDTTKQINVIGVYIYESSKFVKHGFLSLPFVKLHIFNIKRETLIDPNAQILTKPYSIFLHGTMSPQWNELVLFENELIDSLIKLKDYLILFEVIDKNTESEKESGNTNLGIAFIKPYFNKLNSNINNKLKLQLYEYPSLEKSKSYPDALFQFWKSKNWTKYPGFLKITLRGVRKPENVENIEKIRLALIGNELKSNTNQQQLVREQAHSNNQYTLLERHKLAHCKIPNRLTKEIYNSEKGSTAIKFSNCGKFLACSVVIEKKYFILIYKLPDLIEIGKLIGHTNVIYDLCWTELLASASADCSVCLWKVNETSQILVQKMIHSNFVYAVKTCTYNQRIIVTGSYDKTIRVWLNSENGKSVDYKLHQELDGHEGFINTVNFPNNSDTFYSGDSNGVIIKWNCDGGSWYNVQKIIVKEFKDNIINDIQLFPNGRRMLVSLRHSGSWNLDLMTQTAFTYYKDNDSCRYLTRGIISPCSTMVFARNKVFDSATGKLLANYDPIVLDNNPIIAIDYNSSYHLIAFSSHARNAPLIVSHFEESSQADTALGLDMFMTISTKVPLPFVHQKAVKDVIPEKPQSRLTDTLDSNNLKLWDLILKMDTILKNAKRGKSKLESRVYEGVTSRNVPKFNGNIYKIENSLVEPPNEKEMETFSIDLSKFHKIMDKPSDRELMIQNAEDSSECEGTYNVKERRIPIHSPNTAVIAFEDSSTLSQAESLEDDCQTYSIHLDKA